METFCITRIWSLACVFYSRVQAEHEDRGAFSRALTRLYSRMFTDTKSASDRAALEQLRSSALKELLVRGVRDSGILRHGR